jgi:hypothetical protein
LDLDFGAKKTTLSVVGNSGQYFTLMLMEYGSAALSLLNKFTGNKESNCMVPEFPESWESPHPRPRHAVS